MTVYSALWILMARCFRTKTSVAIVLTTYPCVSNCLGVKPCCRHSGDYQWQIISRHNIDLLINNVLHVLCADILPFVFYLKCFPNYHMIFLDKAIKISKKKITYLGLNFLTWCGNTLKELVLMICSIISICIFRLDRFLNFWIVVLLYPCITKLLEGYVGITLSICLSIRLPIPNAVSAPWLVAHLMYYLHMWHK